jgi:hypothetical protein
MPYIFFVSSFFLVVAFFIKTGALHHVITKKFSKDIDFIKTTEGIFLYEVGVFLIWFFVYPNYDLMPISHSLLLLTSLPILYLMFWFIFAKLASLNWKEALIIFFLLFLVVNPIVYLLYQKISIEAILNINVLYKEFLSLALSEKDPGWFQIISKIEDSLVATEFLLPIELDIRFPPAH